MTTAGTPQIEWVAGHMGLHPTQVYPTHCGERLRSTQWTCEVSPTSRAWLAGASIWKALRKQDVGPELSVDALICCDGAASRIAAARGATTVSGGLGKEGQAIGVVANFVNGRSKAERDLRQFSWAREPRCDQSVQHQPLQDPQGEGGRGSGEHRHYMIMTPSKQCLVDKGCLHTAEQLDGAPLLHPSNVEIDNLKGLAQEVAQHFGLPTDFTPTQPGPFGLRAGLGWDIYEANVLRRWGLGGLGVKQELSTSSRKQDQDQDQECHVKQKDTAADEFKAGPVEKQKGASAHKAGPVEKQEAASAERQLKAGPVKKQKATSADQLQEVPGPGNVAESNGAFKFGGKKIFKSWSTIRCFGATIKASHPDSVSQRGIRDTGLDLANQVKHSTMYKEAIGPDGVSGDYLNVAAAEWFSGPVGPF
eukprot:s7041_g1.t1